MGADFYLETFVIVKFKDAAKNSERIFIGAIPSWLDNLEDGQEYNKTIIYENNIWNVQRNYEDFCPIRQKSSAISSKGGILDNIQLNFEEIQKIEEIIFVRERF